MTDHPSREEVVAVYEGGLSPEREREVLGHLLSPCALCLAEAAAPMVRMRKALPEELRVPSSEEEISYDVAIRRAIDAALRQERFLRRQWTQARKALRLLEAGGLEALQKLPRGLGGLARMEAFLARSWQLRHEDPQLMVQFAWLAAQVSLRLDPRDFDRSERVCDFQAPRSRRMGQRLPYRGPASRSGRNPGACPPALRAWDPRRVSGDPGAGARSLPGGRPE